MPSVGMQVEWFGGGALGVERAPGPWALPLRALLSSRPGRDDGPGMAPDPEQLALRLDRCSDAELLVLTRSVPDAFDVFYRRHGQAIAAYLWRQTGDRDVALDLASETFAVAFEVVDRYEPGRGDARGWLFGIAKNVLLTSYRRRTAERSARDRLGLTVQGYSDAAWQEAEARIEAALPDLVDGVDSLPRAERMAVVARVLEEREYAEIAASEHATEAAIRQRVKRGLGRLRKQIGGEDS